MSFYQPRERKGPGVIESKESIRVWWIENGPKFWNPLVGLYVDQENLEQIETNLMALAEKKETTPSAN